MCGTDQAGPSDSHAPSSFKHAKHAPLSAKKIAGARRAIDLRKTSITTTQEKKLPVAAMVGASRRAERNLCGKLWQCAQRVATSCEHFAMSFLRVSFFAMNLVMLHFCIVNLD